MTSRGESNDAGRSAAWLRRALEGGLSTLFTPCCAACGAVLETPLAGAVCARCWETIQRIAPPVCETCGDPIARPPGAAPPEPAWCRRCAGNEPAPVGHRRSLGLYQGSLRGIVHALKYDGRRSLAPPLGRLIDEAWGALLADADALVPVPLHPWRQWRRGFNQADAIAQAIGRRRRLPVLHVLRRTRATRPQQELDASGRRRNVAGAFALAGWTRRARIRRTAMLRGRILVMVDDVATTGATLEACGAVLRAAGAREVRAVTAARVVLS